MARAPGCRLNATVNTSGSYVNYAQVLSSTSGDLDSTPGNGSTTEDDDDTLATMPQVTSDLSLALTVSNSTPLMGSTIAYTVTVTNGGPNPAASVSVRDLLPPGYIYVSNSPTQGAYNNSTGDWTGITLASGASARLRLNATVNTTGSYSNYAQVLSSTSGDLDSTPGNGSTTEDDDDTLATTPQAAADLSLGLVVSRAAPLMGSTIAYTVTVTNAGPSQATGVTVRDLLPAGYTYVSNAPTQGSYNNSTGDWTGITLASGANARLRLNATVNLSGSYSNYAQVLASPAADPDSIPGNGSTTEDDDDTLATSPVAAADLSLALAVSNSTPLMGSTIAYTVTVTNAGPSQATGVTVRDLLPAGYTYVSNAPTQGSYNNSTGDWTGITLASGASARLRLNATVNTTGSYSNYAQVWASGIADPDSIPGNGSTTEDDDDTLATTPQAAADLSLGLVVSRAAPLYGSTIAYTVTVTNAGPSQATGVTVRDLLPSGYTYVSNAPTQGGYNNSTGDWTGITLASGASARLRMNATVNLSGSYSNYAQVWASPAADPDSIPGNGSTTEDDDDTLATVPVAAADLSVVLAVSNSTPLMGSTIAYTVTVTNAGPSQATGVTVRDLLPSGYTYVSNLPTQGSYNNSTGDWTGITLASGASARLRLNATVNTTGSYSNYAQVWASGVADPDSIPGNGSTTEDDDDTLATVPVAAADLSVALSVSNAAPLMGSTIAYTVTVTNAGPNQATGVMVRDLLPSGYTYVSNAPTQGGYNNSTGDWSGITLASGASARLRINATVNLSGSYSNYAQVLASPAADPDSIPGNGSTTEDDDDTLATVPVAAADLSVVLAVSNSTPLMGSTIAYTVTVTNAGPSQATGVTVRDLLPAGYTYVSNAPTQGSYNNSTGDWTGITLASGASARLRLNATVNTTGSYSNYAQVWAGGVADPDSIPGNGSTTEDDDDTLATVPVAAADLSVALSVSNAAPQMGSTIAYTVTVTNAGPSQATGVTVRDLLPAGYTYVSNAPTQGSYNNSTGDWTGITLASGASARLRLNMTVNTTGSYSNYAQVWASGVVDPDSTPGNGSTTEDDDDTLATIPVAAADLSVALSVSNAAPLMGSTIAYTVTVTNAGPSQATGVTVRDLLPSGYTYVSNLPTQGSYNNGTGDWTGINLASGANARLRLNMTVNITGSYSNYAQVWASGEADPDSTPGNGSTTEDDDDTLATVPVAAGDLSVALTVSNAAPLMGSTIAYTVTVTNAGPSQATGVTVRDLLPAGYTYVSSVPSQGAYNNGTGDWSGITLASGASARLRLNATVNTTGSYSNYAQVWASGVADPDLTPGNGSTTEDDDDTLATIPVPAANLSLTKVAQNDPVTAGTSMVYMLTVTNLGPSNTANTVVTDTLPAGVTYQSYSGTGWTCTLNTGRVVCTRAGMNNGTSSSVALTLLVNSGTTGTLSNTAVVSSSMVDPIMTNNSATETTTINTSANLGVTLTDAPDPVNAGSNLTYTVTVSNAGTSDAVGVVFTDTLPTSVTYQSFTGTGWTCTLNGVRLRCARTANLVSGTNDRVVILTRVNSSTAAGSLSNSVLVRSNTSDPVANNTATATTTVRVSADLRISKVDTVDPVAPGTGMAYTIVITNTGPSDAVGVRITDTLPTGVSYVAHVPTPEWTCSTVGSELRCSRAAAMVVNARLQVDVAVLVGAGVTGSLNNFVRVGAASPDPLSGNNSDTETTTVVPQSDLSLAKVASSNPVIAGTNLTYTLTVSNLGPSNAASLVVTDTLPSNVTYQSYGGSSGWTCSLLSGNRLRCTRASLNVSANSLVSILTRVNSAATGSLSNTALVRSSWLDPSLTNNTANLITTVNAQADMSVTKTDAPDPVAEGQTLTYRMVVRNNGPSNAASVSLSDPLPTTRLTYVSAASTPQGTCSWSSPNLTCSLGTIANGGAVTVTVTTTARPVGDNLPKTAANTATVSTATTDPNSANNTSTSNTQIQPAADLRVNLASLVTTIQTGNPLTYTIWITNTGPSIATNVVLTDTLPAELTFKSSSRTPAVTSPKVVWNLGNLGVGQSLSFTLVVNVTSPTQTLLNSIAARSATWDVVTANSQDQVSVQAVDSVVPTAVWKLPVTEGQVYIVVNQNVLLEVEAADNVAVAYVRFYRWDPVLGQIVEIGNDSTIGTCQYNPSKLCYQWNLDTRVLRPKWNEIRAQAYDASGNFSPDGYRILLKYFGEQIFLPFARK